MATINNMTKKRTAGNPASDQPKTKGGTDVIRVDADLAYKLGVIASIEKKNVSEIVSPELRQFVEKRYLEALKKAAEYKPN